MKRFLLIAEDDRTAVAKLSKEAIMETASIEAVQ
jgi:hypothetical protein